MRNAKIWGLPLALLMWASCGEGNVTLEGTTRSSMESEGSQKPDVYVTIREIHAHVVDKGKKHRDDDHDHDDGKLVWTTRNGKWRAATLDVPRTLNLTRLRDRTVHLADLDLPEGKITQIRLFLDERGRNEVVLPDGSTCSLRIPSANQSGIKIIKPFKSIEVKDEDVRIVIDFNLKESVKKDERCAYKLDPVFKARVEG
jgi:hypothetical protein